jgi:glutathione S-transferase
MSLTIYGHPVSQPTRAVLWALCMQRVAHNFVLKDPTSGDGDKPEYLAEFPTGLIPGLADGDLRLTEGAAILIHLAETRGWDDLLPKDPATRAKVHQWLHWHHSNSRRATSAFFRPVLVGVFASAAKAAIPAAFAKGQVDFRDACLVLEAALAKTPFICGDAPTIADILIYCEFDQLAALGLLGVAGVSDYPGVSAWVERMTALPEHDKLREPLDKFAEIARPVIAEALLQAKVE